MESSSSPKCVQDGSEHRESFNTGACKEGYIHISVSDCRYNYIHISLSVYNKYTCAEVYLRVYVFMCAHVCAFVNVSACKTSRLSEPMGVGYGTEVVKKKNVTRVERDSQESGHSALCGNRAI